MNSQEKNDRIPSVIAGLMISVALIFDLFQFGLNFIPIAGNLLASVVEVFAFLTFFLWFNFHGVKYNGRKTTVTFVSALIEFIPVLNALPALTISVIAMIAMTKTEDLVSNKISLNKTTSQSKQKEQERIQQIKNNREATNDRIYEQEPTENVSPVPANIRQNPSLTNTGFKGVPSSNDSSRFIKTA